ncbi:hypothetical protein DM860_009964 [Cuscuta australis]|uniref:Uncharacterized protein n=1 Tax=Cuscuta australis TaxID=267555 RepID=A0A328DBF2_9ASTE|nr:hypothetical protein DM860_009964 [Cuscuta australis]
MGVPSFYKWLVKKYPKIVENAVEMEGVEVDSSLPNPNGLEFDNFYLDMNGIIHPCFHPEETMFPPTTYEEVFNSIFDYIDRLFNIVRPRKLLYMAIDGVAPRAKMNQQRARRFRTAMDKEIMEEEERKLRQKFASEGKEVLAREESEVSDSNVITPGTFFMYALSAKLRGYIQERIRSNPGWKGVKVILSDSNVPGEGEHKINSFIRAQRTFPDYNPNTRHCLYGLDADLIMLALASHELHFSVFRENVLIQDDLSNQLSSLELGIQKAETHIVSSRGWFGKQDDAVNGPAKAKHCRTSKNKFQFLNVWVLREYLELDICTGLLAGSKQADLERVIDDFVFMCFFAGNDFLPHMPTLDIHEGAIDLLIYVYKKEFKNLGGYLVDIEMVDDPKCGFIKLSRVERFILSVGTFEEKIFMKRLAIKEKKNRRLALEARDDDEENGDIEDNVPSFVPNTQENDIPSILENTKELKRKLKEIIRHNADTFKHGVIAEKVKLGSHGWRERYYMLKFNLERNADVEETRKDVVQHYTEGLLWVLLYYFNGVPSWGWYYPHHYGPFASDMKGMAQTKVKFKIEEPFKPFDQLMSVLPPGSAHALPGAYQMLMLDDKSTIIDFYPTNFETDLDGKRFMWQGVTKLPFIEEKRLLAETNKLGESLTNLDKERNSVTAEKLFMERSCELAVQILSLFTKGCGLNENDAIKFGRALSGGICGTVWLKKDEKDNLSSDILFVFFRTSPISSFIPRVLAGTDFPREKTVHECDIEQTVLWHEFNARPAISYSNRPHNQGNRGKPLANGSMGNHRNSVPHELVTGVGRFKEAGTGWAGRGKIMPRPELQAHYSSPRFVAPQRPRYMQPTAPPRNQWQMGRAAMSVPPPNQMGSGVRPNVASHSVRQQNPWRVPGPPPPRSSGENQWQMGWPTLSAPPPNQGGVWCNVAPRNVRPQNPWRVLGPPPGSSGSGNEWRGSGFRPAVSSSGRGRAGSGNNNLQRNTR